MSYLGIDYEQMKRDRFEQLVSEYEAIKDRTTELEFYVDYINTVKDVSYMECYLINQKNELKQIKCSLLLSNDLKEINILHQNGYDKFDYYVEYLDRPCFFEVKDVVDEFIKEVVKKEMAGYEF